MHNTPLSEQPKIVLYGLRNSGKSSLMNNLFEKQVAVVSAVAGTTTDCVTRSMELAGLGPVAVTDVPGFDDSGTLGEMRKAGALKALTAADIILFVTRGDLPLTEQERELINKLKANNRIFMLAVTFKDKGSEPEKNAFCREFPCVAVNNLNREGIRELKLGLISFQEHITREISPLEGLVQEGDFVLLVTPIDLAAPKNRLILPQVEVIRDSLDKDCGCFVVKERELKNFYDKLGIKPKLVITDSQVFNKAAADIPADQPLTSFSILFARKKGDLGFYVQGIKHLPETPPDAEILVLESCNHHKAPDDIGTVKIPRLFKQLVQPTARFTFLKELPPLPELKKFHMVINCAGCMATRNRIMERIRIFREHHIYAVNYGLFLAWVNGLIPRALEPFPGEWET